MKLPFSDSNLKGVTDDIDCEPSFEFLTAYRKKKASAHPGGSCDRKAGNHQYAVLTNLGGPVSSESDAQGSKLASF